jgi:hypothetical protein
MITWKVLVVWRPGLVHGVTVDCLFFILWEPLFLSR